MQESTEAMKMVEETIDETIDEIERQRLIKICPSYALNATSDQLIKLLLKSMQKYIYLIMSH